MPQCSHCGAYHTERVLGVGIRCYDENEDNNDKPFIKNENTHIVDGEEINLIDTSMEFLCIKTWMKDGIHHSATSNTALPFHYWLPLYLTSDHWRKAHFFSKKGISGICCGSPQRFRPPMILRALPHLLHRSVVRSIAVSCESSNNDFEKNLELKQCLHCWISVHRTFIEYLKMLPKLATKLLSRNALFTECEQPKYRRNKEKVPNITPLLVAALAAAPVLRNHASDQSHLFEWDFLHNKSPPGTYSSTIEPSEDRCTSFLEESSTATLTKTFRDAWVSEYLSRSVFWWLYNNNNNNNNMRLKPRSLFDKHT